MKYLDPSFTVAVGSKAYREGCERTFGRRAASAERRQVKDARQFLATPSNETSWPSVWAKAVALIREVEGA